MRWSCLILFGLIAILPAYGQGPAPLPWVPMPRVLEEDDFVDSQAADKLRESLQRLQKERGLLENALGDSSKRLPSEITPLTLETAVLRLRLQKLIDELESAKPKPFPPMPAKLPMKAPIPAKENTAKGVNAPKSIPEPLAQGQTLQKANNYSQALDAYRRIPLTGRPDDTLHIKYLMAVCLDRMNRPQEAMAMFEDVIKSGKDQPIQESAVWRLQSLRWRQGIEDQLKSLRKKREALEAVP